MRDRPEVPHPLSVALLSRPLEIAGRTHEVLRDAHAIMQGDAIEVSALGIALIR
jgi:hypothetical protein